LSNCFSQSETIEAALLRYQQKRIARTTRIVNDSFNLGKVAQAKNPILAALRDTMMRLTPASVAQRQMKFLYDISFT
jgi:2-polyprenyl-6-methoxyphenol hydroxylase-like FAD-dependent oxidoreductase